MEKIENKQIDFDIKNVFDIEVDKEDRDVGVFGNFFTLGFETDEKENLFLTFNDDEFMLLMEKMKPYFLEEQAQEEHDKEMYKIYLEEQAEKEKAEKIGKIVTLLKFLRLRK